MICRVTSGHQFSAAIREEIKFAVSKNTSLLRICTQPYLDVKISEIFSKNASLLKICTQPYLDVKISEIFSLYLQVRICTQPYLDVKISEISLGEQEDRPG